MTRFSSILCGKKLDPKDQSQTWLQPWLTCTQCPAQINSSSEPQFYAVAYFILFLHLRSSLYQVCHRSPKRFPEEMAFVAAGEGNQRQRK